MPARRQRETCPVCGGRKKTNQWTGKGGAHYETLPCLKCGGKGYLLKPLSDAQRLRAVEKDIKRLQRRVKELEDEPRLGKFTPANNPVFSEARNYTRIEYLNRIEPKKPPTLEPKGELP